MNSPGDDINQLVTGCINNDRKTQERLYRNYYKVMMNLCLRYCNHDADALAVLNMAFYKVFKHIETYDASKGQLYTWIRKIVINECFNHLKLEKNKLKPMAMEVDHELTIVPAVYEKMKEADLLSLIHRLPPATRAVFNLFVMEGFSHMEISQMVGISEGTSKWHLNEARKKLQALILHQKDNS